MLLTLTAALLILLALFVLAWLYSKSIHNASIVDALWALSLPIPVALYTLKHDGSFLRDFMLLAMALIWSLRLGSHLAKRIYRHHPVEDPRYASLREKWGTQANSKFLGIFLMNAGLVFLFSLPFYVSSKSQATISPLEITALILFIIGVIGEMIADKQLADFVKQATKNEVCQTGLWNYSRHPNYFFEAVIWVAIYLFACGSDGGIYTIHAPVIMILFLTKITGIPPAEKSSLKSKGDAYKQYQKTTSPFIPWFKKSI